MRLPTINQYLDSIESPFGMFKTIGEIEAERDAYNRVKVRTGNSAAIFKATIDGNAYMLKCYIKAGRHLQEKYAYMAKQALTCDFINPSRLLPEEIFIYDYNGQGAFHDLAISDWVKGMPLNIEIEWAISRNDMARLKLLSEKFDKMSLSILLQEWAHGDIKPENIIVSEEGELTLIDYDAIFIPQLSGQTTSEVGTDPFQHPLRDTNMYNKHIDDYSIAIISVSLHALLHTPTLYAQYHKGDNIILDPAEIICGNSEALDKILAIWSRCGHTELFRLTQLLTSATAHLPSLESILTNVIEGHLAQTCINLIPAQRHGLWGYANEHGEIVIEPIYDNAHSFSCGLAAVCLHGEWHFIDYQQNAVINCTEYSDVKPFVHNLAAVRREDQWGYIHTTKGQVIDPIYQMVSSFREEVAAVKLNGKYGYIDKQGEWHIEPQFDHATSFKNNKAEVEKEGEVFYINKMGQKL